MGTIKWHRIIKSDKSKIEDLIDYFENELENSKKEVKAIGVIETIAKNLPYHYEERYSQLQEIEAVLEVLDIELEELKSNKFRNYLEHYNRVLSSRDCNSFVDGEKEVVALRGIINEVAYIRNRYLGLLKSMEQLGYALGHIAKLRVAGIENARLD